MPIKDPSSFVFLRESATPLLKSKIIGKELGINLYFKVEGKTLLVHLKIEDQQLI